MADTTQNNNSQSENTNQNRLESLSLDSTSAQQATEPGAAGVAVGSRVQDRKGNHRGVVQYVGCVDGSEGMWLGVEWDDVNRGKHDGCHKGTRYFSARAPLSGSFVRPGAVQGGVGMEAAVRGQYQSPPPDSSQVEHMLQHAINARFVQFVGMEKISKRQSALKTLTLVDLKECLVSHAGPGALCSLLPRLTQLSLSSCLLGDWQAVAAIAVQLPRLRLLNVSENRLHIPDCPASLSPSLQHVTHVVMNNMIGYSWQDLLTCAAMFPHLHTLQVAYNGLETLGPVPCGVLDSLELLDVGANPLSDWGQLLHLGNLPRLSELNVNNCQLPHVEFPQQDDRRSTPHFGQLLSLYIANNPLDKWRTVCQLSRLASLRNLTLSFTVTAEDYFPEFTYAIIRTLKALNRTEVTPKEKRDYELYYLKSFSSEYYNEGGMEDPDAATLTDQFKEKHPTYLQLVRELDAPFDESKGDYPKKKSRLRDQKLQVSIVCCDGRTLQQSVLPTVKVARLKMMLRRTLKLPNSAKLRLSYTAKQTSQQFRIAMDSDHNDIAFYSLADGDTLNVEW